MKTIGLIGGMSWESSAIYYKLINQNVREQLGGSHSAKSIMVSVDFAEIEELQHQNNWNKLTEIIIASAKHLEKSGADLIVLCTNTMHLCSDEIIKNTNIPFLHIAQATVLEIQNSNIKKVGLLGTKFTMEKDFYKKILSDNKIEVVIPNKSDRNIIHKIIYEELVQGKILEHSKNEYQRIIKDLENNGAKGVILGCTEIPLLIKRSDVNIPIFDTTEIHAKTAVKFALGN